MNRWRIPIARGFIAVIGAIVVWLLSTFIPPSIALLILLLGGIFLVRPLGELERRLPDGTVTIVRWTLKDYIGIAIFLAILIVVGYVL